jgi:hypothetical protein
VMTRAAASRMRVSECACSTMRISSVATFMAVLLCAGHTGEV